MNEVRDAGEVILDRIAQLENERARVEALIAGEMLAFVDLRRRESESQIDPVVRRLQASFASDELALVLQQPTRTVQCRLADTRRVRELLPRTWGSFCFGQIDAYRIQLIASAAGKLTEPASLLRLDEKVAAYADSHTAAQTKAWLRRFVIRHEPDKRDVRNKYELSRRGVWIQHHDDGVSTLYAMMSTKLANRIDRLLTRSAKKLPADERTLDNKRADVLAERLLGDAEGGLAGGAVIGITVPVLSLAGLTDNPGESFDGEFALPAGMVRELAREPGTLFHRVFTDPLGHILDVTELGRFPSKKLDIALQIRDGTCAFPTCSRPAAESDNDHDIPHPRGPTSGDNLRPLCRRHHRFKTFRIVGTSMDSSGHRWHLPSGKTVESESRELPSIPTEPSHYEHLVAQWIVRTSLVA